MALATTARKNPRRNAPRMSGMGYGMKGGMKMHGGKKKAMKWLKSAGKTLKKATKKKSVDKMIGIVDKVADVADIFVQTEENKAKIDKIRDASKKSKAARDIVYSKPQSGSGRRRRR